MIQLVIAVSCLTDAFILYSEYEQKKMTANNYLSSVYHKGRMNANIYMYDSNSTGLSDVTILMTLHKYLK